MSLPAQPPVLTDGVVTLHDSSDVDIEAIEKGLCDPEVIRWFGPPTLDATETLERNRRLWAEGTGATFSIGFRGDHCVGLAWLNIGEQSRASVGYWLAPEARGRGLASRSVRLISGWAFRDLGIARLGLLAAVANARSRAVAERCGYRFEGVMRSFEEINAVRVDVALYSLLPGELVDG